MSLLKRAAAIAGLTIATTAAAQGEVKPTKVVDATITTNGGYLNFKINEGPMAGQTIAINTVKDSFELTTSPTANGTLNSAYKLFPALRQAQTELSAVPYHANNGVYDAECRAAKVTSRLDKGAPNTSPEVVSYEFICKTAFGNAALIVMPYALMSAYTYKPYTDITTDPKTGGVTVSSPDRTVYSIIQPQ